MSLKLDDGLHVAVPADAADDMLIHCAGPGTRMVSVLPPRPRAFSGRYRNPCGPLGSARANKLGLARYAQRSWQKTASALFAHRQTIIYRMRKNQ